MASEQQLLALLSSGVGSKKNNVITKTERGWLLGDFVTGRVDVLILETELSSMLNTLGFTRSVLESFPEAKAKLSTSDFLDFVELGSAFAVEVTRPKARRKGILVFAVSRVRSGWGEAKDRRPADGSKRLLPVDHFNERALSDSFKDAAALIKKSWADRKSTKSPVVACPRFCQGVGGRPWSDVVSAINAGLDGSGITVTAYVQSKTDK